MPIKENLYKVPASGRFVDHLELKANGEGADKNLIKHSIEGSYQNITYKQFRNGVNSAAAQLKEIINDSFTINDEGFATVGYLSNSGSDYALNAFALILLNLTPIFLSPRNSIDILVHLLNIGNSKTLVYSEDFKDLALEIKEHIPTITLVPNIGYETVDYKDISLVEPLVSMDKYNGDCGEHIMAIIHSSGSTSYPKLIKLSNRYFFTMNERTNSEIINTADGSILNCAPLFHIYGFGKFAQAISKYYTISFPSTQVVTVKSLLQDAKNTNACVLILLPYLVKQIQEYCYEEHTSKTWDYLSQLTNIVCAGSILPEEISKDFKAHNVKLTNMYGLTETGILALSSTGFDNSDFQVLRLKEGLKYRQIFESEDTFRIVINQTDQGLASGLGLRENDGYPVGDLFKIVKQDSSQNELEFVILGRTDDTIVHISGEKTNPVPIEQHITSSPYVQHCVIYGTGKLQCACIIQLNYEICSTTSIIKLHDEIFKTIKKANNDSPTHSRILPELVLILPLISSKIFPVTPKGNAIRNKAIDLFKDEIQELYEKLETYEELDLNEDTDVVTREGIERNISNLFEKITFKNLNDKFSFFNQGLDSLTSVKLRNNLNVKYPKAKLNISSIYENDTLKKLSNHIFNLLNNSVEFKTIESHIKDVEQLIIEYTKFENFTITSNFIKPLAKEDTLNVLITGANGSLGQFIVKSLLQNPNVGKIYGLARAKDQTEALKRIQEGFSERKIDLTEQQWSQIVALPYKSDDSQLGLDNKTYTAVLNSVDIIYHVAWRMDFLKGVFAFRDNIESTVNLLRISAFSPRKPVFGFVSSVGATLPLLDSIDIKESQLHTELKNLGSCNGYNLSKLVCEHLIYKWHHKYKIPIDIFRVGQLSGDTKNGVWNLNEYIPLLVKGIQTMKVAPATFSQNTTWIPVDIAAKGITDITFNDNNRHEITISHIVNPHATSWSDILLLLKQCGIQFQVIDSDKFIDVLNESKYQNVDLNPIASLTDFFINALIAKKFEFNMETVQTQKLSTSINNCKPTDSELFNKFINYWREVKFM